MVAVHEVAVVAAREVAAVATHKVTAVATHEVAVVADGTLVIGETERPQGRYSISGCRTVGVITSLL